MSVHSLGFTLVIQKTINYSKLQIVEERELGKGKCNARS